MTWQHDVKSERVRQAATQGKQPGMGSQNTSGVTRAARPGMLKHKRGEKSAPLRDMSNLKDTLDWGVGPGQG